LRLRRRVQWVLLVKLWQKRKKNAAEGGTRRTSRKRRKKRRSGEEGAGVMSVGSNSGVGKDFGGLGLVQEGQGAVQPLDSAGDHLEQQQGGSNRWNDFGNEDDVESS
jgi:hypothetical protein